MVGVVWIMSMALHRLTKEAAGEAWTSESWFKFIALMVLSMGLYLTMSVRPSLTMSAVEPAHRYKPRQPRLQQPHLLLQWAAFVVGAVR